ncbi:uncharacterized protein TRIADDRAFT_61519 [Trichoplax adhaerens]|uniref:Uncharacterized protein n=1 Tax=Trichoplax adhaerens TaxID=10228 RepID=B3SB78_TRIAD|nr:predicted protein [Trichoplax adhaerens]EDV20059.1 predicted protein [Trichoplax adhaerens]|eukprot:XP_002117443.1 predicted protein [Trichoplax adhaerens]
MAFTNNKENLVSSAKLSLKSQAIIPLDTLLSKNSAGDRFLVVANISCYQLIRLYQFLPISLHISQILYLTKQIRPSFSILSCEFSNDRDENKLLNKPCDTFLINQYCQRKVTADKYKNDQITLLYEINNGNLSKLYIQSCQSKDAIKKSRWLDIKRNASYCKADLTFINKNAEYAFNIYVVMLLFWCILTVFWILNWIMYWKYSNNLHKIITVYPIIKVTALLFTTIRLQILSTSDTTVTVFDSIENPFLFAIVMLISEGYCIIKDSVSRHKIFELAVYSILFSISTMCMLLIHKYFLSVMVFCAVVMMYKALKWCTYNIMLLRQFSERLKCMVSEVKLVHMTHVTPQDQIAAKLNILLRLRHICAIFSVMFAAAITLTSLLYQLLWIQALFFEIPKTFLYTCIAYLCRLRNFAPYNEITLAIPSMDYNIIYTPRSSGEDKLGIYLAIPLENGENLVDNDELNRNTNNISE